LEQQGHAVQLERSAERAMALIQEGGEFDIVALRLMLHGMDGAELCRWIEAETSLRGIPKVAFTGPGSRIKLSFDGKLPRWFPVDRFINELDDPRVLIETVEQLLSR